MPGHHDFRAWSSAKTAAFRKSAEGCSFSVYPPQTTTTVRCMLGRPQIPVRALGFGNTCYAGSFYPGKELLQPAGLCAHLPPITGIGRFRLCRSQQESTHSMLCTSTGPRSWIRTAREWSGCIPFSQPCRPRTLEAAGDLFRLIHGSVTLGSAHARGLQKHCFKPAGEHDTKNTGLVACAPRQAATR